MMLACRAILLAGLVFATAGVRADEPVKVAGSLQLVPADAATYSVSLRLGEQIDAFLSSKAYAKLRALPAAKFAFEKMRSEVSKPDNPLGHVIRFLQMPENKELADVLLDLSRHEVFVYGGANTGKFVAMLGGMYTASQFAPLTGLMRGQIGEDANALQLKAIMEYLKNSPDKFEIPDLIMGFRSTKPAELARQLTKWEGALKEHLKQAPPELQKRLKRVKVGDADALTVTGDGSMIPWKNIPWDKMDIDPDEMQPLIDKLKAMTLTVAIAQKGDYLLMTIGSDTSALASFGKGPSLATRPEFSPLAKYADRKITAINYSSLKLAEATATTGKDVQDMFDKAKEALDHAPIGDELKKSIAKDLDGLAKEVITTLPRPYATMGFSFLNGRGMDTYAYAYNDPKADDRPLTIFDHLGGSPLIGGGGRSPDATPAYKNLVKWIKIFYGHAEAVAKEMLDEDRFDQVKMGISQAMPFIKRFNEITGDQLLPALADGQGGVSIDAKWKSKAWFPEFDQHGVDLPLPEVGFVFGVSDSEKLVAAFKGYRALVNELLGVARNFGAAIPEEGWPAPKTQSAGSATLFYWPLPDAGQDKAIMPNIGVSKSWMTLALSAGQAERLQTAKPFSVDLKTLADGKTILNGGVVDFAGINAVARIWVEKIAVPQALKDAPDNAPEGLKKADIPAQVSTVFDVLGCLKNVRMVSYKDGKATVTHAVTTIEDLK